jgi:hypothetical protein
MSRPTVLEVNFHEFKRALESALTAGARITPGEPQRWKAYVDANKVRELNFQAYVRGKHDNLVPVIIDTGPPWGGYYMWSAKDEVALRWQPADAGSTAAKDSGQQ